MAAGFENFTIGIEKTGFIVAAGNSAFITVFSVMAILLFTSMTAWWITRVKSKFTSNLLFVCILKWLFRFKWSCLRCPKWRIRYPWIPNPGIIPVYVGFGAGLCVFMFSGFIKSIPISLEAMIDGCNPIQTFFFNCLSGVKTNRHYRCNFTDDVDLEWLSTSKLVLSSDYQTIPIAVQYLRGGYGSIDMGALMAMLGSGNRSNYCFLSDLSEIYY